MSFYFSVMFFFVRLYSFDVCYILIPYLARGAQTSDGMRFLDPVPVVQNRLGMRWKERVLGYNNNITDI